MKSYILLHEDEYMPYTIYLNEFNYTLLVVTDHDIVVKEELFLTDIESFQRAYDKAINILRLR